MVFNAYTPPIDTGEELGKSTEMQAVVDNTRVDQQAYQISLKDVLDLEKNKKLASPEVFGGPTEVIEGHVIQKTAEPGEYLETENDAIFMVSPDGVNFSTSMNVPADGVFYIKGMSIGNADLGGTVSGTENITVTEDLPITLHSFEVKVQYGVFPYLSFTTSSETNNDYFVIERSFDGEVFDVIDTVESKAKNGNSREEINYEYIDKTEGLHGTVYYRLTQVDKDDTKETFEAKSVTIENKNMKPTLSPNPVKAGDKLILNIPEKKYNESNFVRIIDINGKEVFKDDVGAGENSLNISSLSTGIYSVQVLSKDGNRDVSKLSVIN